MSVTKAPHRPSAAEVEAAKELGLPSDPKSTESMFMLAGRAFAQKKYDNAVRILRGLVLVAPNDPRIYESFGVLYLAQGRNEDAMACFSAALELNPLALHANVTLGEMAWRKERNATKAKQFLERIMKTAPQHPVAKRAEMTLKSIAKAAQKTPHKRVA